MRRALLRDGVIYGGATLLSGVSNVVLLWLYTRTIEPTEVGVVELITVLQLLIQVAVGLELTQAIARYYGGAETEPERRSYASTGFWSLVSVYAVVCGLLFVSADRIQEVLMGSATSAGVLRPGLVAVFLGIMFYVVRSQLRWELRAMRYAIATGVAAALTIGLSVYLLAVLRVGVIGVFLALGAGYAAGITTCLYGLRRTYAWSFDVSKLRTMLRFSTPLMISALALFAASYGDRLIIRASLGLGDLGVYAVGARVASVIALASAGFQLGAAPLIYRHYRESGTPEALAQLLRLFIGAGLVGVIALATTSVELLRSFASPAYAEAARIVPVMALATVLASGYVFLPGLTIRELTPRFAAINIAGAATALLLVAGLTPTYGILGAACGALGGAAVGFMLHALFSQRAYPLPLAWPRIGIALAIGFATIPLMWVSGDEMPIALRIMVFVVSALAVAGVLLTSSDRSLIARSVSRIVAPRFGAEL